MRLSIIIPCYNGEKTISRCLESIACQTFSDLEIVFVDDGSTDRTMEIVDAFFAEHQKIRKTIVFQDNIGLTLSRKAGVVNSRGDYVGFIDADDYVEKDFYELLFAGLETDTDIAATGFTMHEGKKTRYFRNETSCVDNVKARESMLRHEGYYQYAWNKIYRRELFEDLEFDERRFIGEDFLMNMRLLERAKKIMLVPGTGYHYVLSKTSQTKSGYGELYRNMYFVLDELQKKENDVLVDRYVLFHYMAILVSMVRNDTHETEIEDKIIFFVKKHLKDYLLNGSDGLMARIAALTLCISYPLFKALSFLVLALRRDLP